MWPCPVDKLKRALRPLRRAASRMAGAGAPPRATHRCTVPVQPVCRPAASAAQPAPRLCRPRRLSAFRLRLQCCACHPSVALALPRFACLAAYPPPALPRCACSNAALHCSPACATPSPSACALASVPRWRASPQSRPRRSNTRLRRFAPQPSRRAEPAPPAVNAPQNLRHPFHGDRPALLPLGQLVDFPYRSGDMVDLQQSPGFRLRDRLGLLPLVDLVDAKASPAPAPIGGHRPRGGAHPRRFPRSGQPSA